MANSGKPRWRNGIMARKGRDGRVTYYGKYVGVDGDTMHCVLSKVSRVDAKKVLHAKRTEVEKEKQQRKKRPLGIAEPTKIELAAAKLTVRQLCQRFCGFVADDNADNFTTGHGGETSDPLHYRRGAWSVLKCHVLPYLGDRPVAGLRQVDIRNLKDALLETAKSTFIVSRTLRQLCCVFNWAVERELVADNPAKGVKKPKTPGATKFYTHDEVARMLAWAAEHDLALHSLISFAFYTGCRKGEIAALRWSDIDWQGERIFVQRSWHRNARKSGQPVVVNMHPHLKLVLEAHHQRNGGSGEDLIFPGQPPTQIGRKRLLGRGINLRRCMRNKYDLWGLDNAIKAESVRSFRNPWHAFRHTHATSLAIGGADLTAIRDALGQATLHMAANYTHLAAEHVRAHVTKLPTLGPVPTAINVSSLDGARRKRA